MCQQTQTCRAGAHLTADNTTHTPTRAPCTVYITHSLVKQSICSGRLIRNWLTRSLSSFQSSLYCSVRTRWGWNLTGDGTEKRNPKNAIFWEQVLGNSRKQILHCCNVHVTNKGLLLDFLTHVFKYFWTNHAVWSTINAISVHRPPRWTAWRPGWRRKWWPSSSLVRVYSIYMLCNRSEVYMHGCQVCVFVCGLRIWWK